MNSPGARSISLDKYDEFVHSFRLSQDLKKTLEYSPLVASIASVVTTALISFTKKQDLEKEEYKTFYIVKLIAAVLLSLFFYFKLLGKAAMSQTVIFVLAVLVLFGTGVYQSAQSTFKISNVRNEESVSLASVMILLLDMFFIAAN